MCQADEWITSSLNEQENAIPFSAIFPLYVEVGFLSSKLNYVNKYI